MSSINTDYSKFMHKYEAFRIPKGHEALKAPNAEAVKAEDGGSILILTPESAKQLVKDRFSYIDVIMGEAEAAASKSQEEGARQYAKMQAKVMSVFRSMAKGNNVPSTDEKKLMEFNDKLYQAAKMAQMLAQQAEKEKEKNEKSKWDEREEAADRKKLKKLGEESTELARGLGQKSHDFSLAQEDMVVEVDAGNVDLGSIKGFFQFTSNIGGAFFDQTI